MYENFIMLSICVVALGWGVKSFYGWAFYRGYDKAERENDVISKWDFENLKKEVAKKK